jgi:hypothetical protein
MSTATASNRDTTDFLDTWTRLLRTPGALVDDITRPGGVPRHAPALLAATVAGGALLGGVVGSHHGGIQTVYAAIKTPLLFLVPPLFALPAVEAAWSLVGTPVSAGRLRAAALVGMARAAVLAAALGPFVWLWTSGGVDYHLAVLVFAGTVVLAGVPGFWTVLEALPRPTELRRTLVFGSLAVLGGVFAQTGWLLRPFVARPTSEVTFLRDVEENAFSSLAASQRSARGHYTGWDARQEGFLAETQPAEPARPVDRFVQPQVHQTEPAEPEPQKNESVPTPPPVAVTEPAESIVDDPTPAASEPVAAPETVVRGAP